MERDAGLALMHEYVEDPGLRRHMLAVEAAMRSYAGELGGDVERWGLAGLLHDFDWEVHPTSEQHPQEGAPILRERGCPEDVVQAILAHNPEGSDVPAAAPMDWALRACDEITGLIIAATLVRPARDLRLIKPKSIRRNWKDRAFTAAISRDEITEAVADFSRECFEGRLELWDHIGRVLQAMQAVAEDLELDGRLAVS